MSFDVVLSGLQELIARVDQPLQPAIDNYTQAGSEKAKQLISTYPPAPPNAHRTGTLGRSWSIQATSSGTFLRSSASYSPFVVGPQQRPGASAWKTDTEVAAIIAADSPLTNSLADDITRRIG